MEVSLEPFQKGRKNINDSSHMYFKILSIHVGSNALDARKSVESTKEE
jgi:hypothetical protein